MSLDISVDQINWSEPFEFAGTTTNDPIPDEYYKCLKDNFGHSNFRKMQWEVIASVLNDRKDACVVMSTGYGKSLCFQFPSVYTNKITIVVSPLISLMQDQVNALGFYNLKACFLGSAQTDRETVYKVIDLQYNIVYVTPEYITSENGDFLLDYIKNELTLIAIDEAHCISKWGHDFRSAYRNLSRLRELCPSVPILALTATATPKVRDDIIKNLKLREPLIVTTGFDRPNLKFLVKLKTSGAVWQQIGPYIERVPVGSIIVYCITRKVAEEVARCIAEHGQSCGVYHAGMALKDRQQTHKDFIHDRIRIVVATIAFGMGINKADVRLVIHYGVSKDVESYYQEAGRAGRDGLPAECILFYWATDWHLHRLIRHNSKHETSSVNFRNLMESMSDYVNTPHCRRRFILSYFNDDCSGLSMRRDCCDNCNRMMMLSSTSANNSITPTATVNLFDLYCGLDSESRLDITDESVKLLTVMNNMHQKAALKTAFLILRGSRSQKVSSVFSQHHLFGSLKDKSEKWLTAVSDRLMREQMLIRKPNKANSRYIFYRYEVTPKGRSWLNSSPNRDPIKIVPGGDFISQLKLKINGPQPEDRPAISTPSTSKSTIPAIERELLKVRSKLARLYDVIPFLVASTTALQQLAVVKPTTMEELRQITLDGFTADKIERFGQPFLNVIRDYKRAIGESVTSPEMQSNGSDLGISSTQAPQAQGEIEPSALEPEVMIKLEVKPERKFLSCRRLKMESQMSNDGSSLDSATSLKAKRMYATDNQCQVPNPRPPADNQVKVEPSNLDKGEVLDLTLSEESVGIVELPPSAPIEIESDLEEDIKEIQVLTQNSVELVSTAIPTVSLIDSDVEETPVNGEAAKVSNGVGSIENLLDDDWETDLIQLSAEAEELEETITNGEENHVRILKKKNTGAFQFINDSSSDTKPIGTSDISPKKRKLLNWMKLSTKKLR